MNTEKELLENGFTLIGIKKNGLKVYARKNALSDDGIVLHKVDKDGMSLGVEFFETETISILTKSNLI